MKPRRGCGGYKRRNSDSKGAEFVRLAGTRDEHRLWLNVDPCGLFTGSLTYFIITFCVSTITIKVLSPWLGSTVVGYASRAVFIALAIMAALSHLRTMLSNPGAVPGNSKPVDPTHWDRACYRCNHFKPPRAHHCSICGRCIIKMDHHCPWVNNCVGLANQKYFLLFLAYTCILSIYGATATVWRFFYCVSTPRVVFLAGSAAESAAAAAAADAGPCAGISGPGEMVLVVVALVLACLFALFTGAMLADQVTSVASNTTQIDRLKAGRGGGGSEDAHRPHASDDPRLEVWHNLSEVFGGDAARDGVQLSWFLPLPIKYRDPEALTGFCFRDVPRPRTAAELEMV